MTHRDPSYQHRGALLLIEEAVHLLRRHPVELLGIYFFGSCPFVLGILYYWSDMSRSAFAVEHCAIASLGLALLFVWMKVWQAVFAGRVTALLQFDGVRHQQRVRWLHLAATQALIHASGILVLPLAALVMLPFGWCLAFYQNVSVFGNTHTQSTVFLCRQAWRQARLWPQQNHQLLGVLSLFSIVVLLNVAIVLFALPHLLKTFLGVESIFTLSGANAVNTTFWAACFGISYLCVDPLFKTTYAIRCFYGAALSTGEDLRVGLFKLRQSTTVAVICWAALIILGQSSPLLARESVAVEPGQLGQSIDETLRQPHFTWRMPREKPAADSPERKGPLDDAVDYCLQTLKQGIDILVGWIDTVVDWLIDLLPDPAPQRRTDASSDWRPTLRVLLIVFLLVLSGMMGIVLWRSRRRRFDTADAAVSSSGVGPPDLDDESLSADAYSSEQWMAMAREMVEKADLRMALRALYLATLSHLAALDWITLEKHKTHRDYVRELRRRRRERTALIEDFHHSGLLYERVWFGMRQIAAQELERFSTLQKRIMAIAQK